MALFGGPSTPVSRLEELKRLLQKDPTSRQFLALAEEYRRHGKYRDAVITLERGLQLHSTSVAAHVALGRTYQQLDRLEDAIRAFTNALRLDRENLVAIRQLAEVYLARGDKIEAIKKLKLYRGLKAGDRDVNDIIQKLEEEMSAAVAERPRSGVQAVFSEFPEAPHPAAHFTSGIRRAQTIPRLERVEAPPPPPPPPETKPDLMELTYDGATRSKSAEAVRLPPPEASPHPPPPLPPLPPPPPVTDVLMETSSLIAPPAEAPTLSPFTAPIASTREQPEPEKAPFALAATEAEPDVPEEEATAPFTFPVDLYRTEAATISASRPVETAPFDVSDARPEVPAKVEPLVSETLGDLYRAQGHMADARETYRTLAETADDEAHARALREKAAALPTAERTNHPRLRQLARRFPKRRDATVDDLHGILSNLVEGTEGIRAATLTDLAGLPVVMAGPASRDAAMETLVAELSSFLKNVRRTTAETGTGELESLAVAGPYGGVVVSPVNADYSLILRVDPEAALGEIRWEAARTARALRPAVR
jgi:predicted regulator of Ras-like GTPase activity (Roadblock/LC7/MglB family)/tetratricopeptide (TPR) repeat protein